MGLKERKSREKEARRKEILDAARRLLFKKGLQGTSISGIAKTAELGIGTIYSYYQNKEELFAALQEEGLEILYQDIRKICRQQKPPGQALLEISMAYLRFSRERKEYFDVINYFLSAPDPIFAPNLKEQVDRQGGRILGVVEKLLREGMRRGDFRTVDPAQSALMLWGMLHGLIQLRKMQPTLLSGRDHAAFFEAAVLEWLAGIAARRD